MGSRAGRAEPARRVSSLFPAALSGSSGTGRPSPYTGRCDAFLIRRGSGSAILDTSAGGNASGRPRRDFRRGFARRSRRRPRCPLRCWPRSHGRSRAYPSSGLQSSRRAPSAEPLLDSGEYRTGWRRCLLVPRGERGLRGAQTPAALTRRYRSSSGAVVLGDGLRLPACTVEAARSNAADGSLGPTGGSSTAGA